ncbi:MAG: NADH-quinone oxidoreductase subunit A [Candidatus Hydrothermarchaeaceae archaeon]
MIQYDYVPVIIFALVGLSFPFILFFVSSLLRPTKPEPEKYVTYECSVLPFGDARIQHNVQYYLIALLFAVFSVEVVFLFPWALVFPSLGWFAVLEMFVFIFVLVIGLAYAWKKGALEWM